VGPAGRAGGGSVPPPSSPPTPSSNRGPRQPNPPGNGFADGVSSAHSASKGIPSSGGNGTTHSTSSPVQSALSFVGGDSLAGSGFEAERVASGFTPTSVPVRPSSAGQTRDGAAPTDGRKDEPGAQGAIATQSLGTSSESLAGVGSTSEVQSVGSASSGHPRTTARERLTSGARRTERTFSGAADRLRGVRRQWRGLPSDAAPHTS
jgi:hypothetical protein